MARKKIVDLYREGVRGGALLSHVEADVEADVAVALAHQSVLAGIMLALQVTAGSVPKLSARRPQMPEGRIDILRLFPQVVPRPRAVTPDCLCRDLDSRARYEQKWRSRLEADGEANSRISRPLQRKAKDAAQERRHPRYQRRN